MPDSTLPPLDSTELTSLTVPVVDVQSPPTSTQRHTVITAICLIGIGMVMIGLVWFVSAYQLISLNGSDRTQPTTNASSVPSPLASTAPLLIPSADPDVNPNVPSIVRTSFADTLAQNCQSKAIALTALPLDFSEQIRNRYPLASTIACYEPSYSTVTEAARMRYLEAHYKQPTSEINGSTLYIFHQNSRYDGFGDPISTNYDLEEAFEKNSEEKNFPVQIDSKKYWLRIYEPGPHGLTDLGPWVSVVGDKQFDQDRAVIRIDNFKDLQLQDWQRLVRKYGTPIALSEGQQTPANFPKYDLNGDPAKKRAFYNEIVPILVERPEIKQMAAEVQADLEGVTELFPE